MLTIESPTLPDVDEAVPDAVPVVRKRAAREAPLRRRNRILSVSADWDDHHTLGKCLGDTAWQIVAATTCREAVVKLNRMRVAVIVCEHTLDDGEWIDLLQYLVRTGRPAPIVVTSRIADEYLWAEVLNLGGYDVLAKPFREHEVVHTITSALLHGAPSAPRTRAAGGG